VIGLQYLQSDEGWRRGLNAMVDYAQRMFDAVSDFEAIDTAQGVTDKLAGTLGTFGYTSFLVTNVPEPPLKLEPYILVNGWPKEWTQHYMRHDYYRHDPVAAWCRKSVDPFRWSDVPIDPSNQKAREVMNVACDFGLIEGYLVPIVRSTGFHACVTMAGREVDPDPDAKRAIHVISMFAHARISALGGLNFEKRKVLSETERDILSWTARGKTSGEIAQIMAISKFSVDTMALRAAQKLGAVNRTQAVVHAILMQEIVL
jgi:LuxR family quorum sensing-dependent transcriptional regulator